MPHGAANIQISCEIAKCAGDGLEKRKGEGRRGKPFFTVLQFHCFYAEKFY